METEDNFPAKHAYAVYTHILGIGDYPFPPLKKVRPNWHFLFKDKKCLLQFKSIYFSDVKNRSSLSKPFIRSLGPCNFRARQNTLAHRYATADNIYEVLSKDREKSSGAYSEEEGPCYPIFGIDLTIKDQQMNHTYIELEHPLVLKAITKGDIQAQGKLFVHLYPSGYIVLLLAVTLNWEGEKNLKDVKEILREIRPWGFQNRHSQWTWTSRLSKKKLPLLKQIQLVKKHLQQSLFIDSSIYFKKGDSAQPWYSALRIVSDHANQGQQAAGFLLGRRTEVEALDMEKDREPGLQGWLVCSKQDLVLIVHPEHERRRDLIFFWEVLHLAEFTLLKKRIYEDYKDMLNSKIQEMKIHRSELLLATKEELFVFIQPTAIIRRFLGEGAVLDNHIKTASSSFHRHIYSVISKATDVDNLRKDLVQNIIPTWEKELDQWVPVLKRIWDILAGPLGFVLRVVPKPLPK